MKLYRIHITHMDDPLQDQRLLELVSPKRREKVIRYRMPDDRKRSLGAGIILREILRENGLNESDLRYSENEKPVADSVFFNVSHAGDYVWEYPPIVRWDVILKRSGRHRWKSRRGIFGQRNRHISTHPLTGTRLFLPYGH